MRAAICCVRLPASFILDRISTILDDDVKRTTSSPIATRAIDRARRSDDCRAGQARAVQSCRSALSGSIAHARRAGIKPAVRATATRVAIAATAVHVSVGTT